MDKPHLILLHGALGSKSYFLDLEEKLKNDFKIFSFDFAGHGNSKEKYSFLIDGFKVQLLKFCSDNKIKNAFIFGYSMGAYVALLAASEKPLLFRSILSLGTKFSWNPEIAKNEIKHLNPIKIINKVPKFASYLKELHPERNWKDVLKDTKELMLDLGENNRIENINFAEISIPVFIGLGTEDKMVSEKESMEVVNKLSNGKFVSFQDFPHPYEKLDITQLSSKIKTIFLN